MQPSSMFQDQIKIYLNYLVKNPIRNILLLELLFRFFLFTVFYHSVSIFTDTEGYTELAQLISSFNLKGYHGLRSPGYPLIISLLFQNLYVVIFFQFGLGIVSSFFWYKSLINFNFSVRNSFIITIFLSSFINVFFFETAILVEATVLFLMSLIVFLLSKNSFENLSISNQLFLSFIFAFLVLIKPFYAFLPFLFIGYSLIRKFNFKRMAMNLILIILPLFVYFGWCYVNKINTGYFVPTSYYGLTNAQNCVYFAEKAPKEFDWISKPYVVYREKSIKENKEVAMAIWYAYEDGAYNKYHLTFHQLSAQLGKFAKVTIKNNPIDYMKQVVFRSWFDFWKPTIYWNYDKFNFKYANKLCLGVFYIQYVISLFFRLFFIALIPYYILQFFKNRKITIALMLTMIVFSNSVLQAIVTYGTNDRYSFPFDFMMIIVVLLFIRDQNLFPKRLRTFLQ
jgi:hypothetical protein